MQFTYMGLNGNHYRPAGIKGSVQAISSNVHLVLCWVRLLVSVDSEFQILIEGPINEHIATIFLKDLQKGGGVGKTVFLFV